MSTHKAFAPSKAERWLACPGGEAYQRQHEIVYERPSVYAMQGTAAHRLLEAALRSNLAPATYRGRIIVVFPDGGTSMLQPGAVPKTPDAFEIDEDMIDAVSTAYFYVQQAKSMFTPPLVEIFVNPCPGRNDTGGTADVILDHGSILEVVDYKHGKGVYVAAEGNPQALSYAAGAAEQTGWVHTRYRATIIQPRHHARAVRTEEISREELRAFRDRMVEGIKRVERLVEEASDLDGYHRSGHLVAGDHCRFCPWKPVCPAIRGMVQDQARVDFAEAPAKPKPPEDVSDVLPWIGMIEDWCMSVKSTATDLLSRGFPVPGYKLVEGRSIRRWKAELSPDQIEAKARDFGVPADQLYKRNMLTGPAAEKLVPKPMRDDFSNAMLEKPPGKPVLATADDRRPAVGGTGAADDFS